MTETSASYDVLLWGSYFCDLIFTDLPAVPRLGGEVFSRSFNMNPGGPFYTTIALHRLGLCVGWACDFGSDSFSQYVLDQARAEGLDTSLFTIHPEPVRRITAVFSFAHDRGFLSFVEDVPQSSPIPLLEQHQVRCLYLPNLHYGEAYADLYAAARESQMLIFMECQSNDATLQTPGVVEALQSVDIFAPNESEALQLTGAGSVEEALAELAALTPLVVIKRGAAGAIARRGDKVVTVPAIDVKVVDTTGAGDCFNAGFLYGYLRGESLEMCLTIGNICGGLSTTAVGGGAIPTEAEIAPYLNLTR